MEVFGDTARQKFLDDVENFLQVARQKFVEMFSAEGTEKIKYIFYYYKLFIHTQFHFLLPLPPPTTQNSLFLPYV